MRVGIGYDIHKLVEGRTMVIGGVTMSYPKGPLGHSDGDALIHAVCDAILGAAGKGDIGKMFPDTDPKFKDISSRELLRDVADLARNEGYRVGNLDCVVIAEEPKIDPYRHEIAGVLGDILGIPTGAVNVKGTTAEKLGVIGEGRAIAAYAVVLLERR